MALASESPRTTQSPPQVFSETRVKFQTHLIALAALALAACSKTANGPAGVRHSWTQPNVLRVAVQSDVKSLNPLLNSNTTDGFIANLLFEPLLSADAKGNPVPILASTVPTPENGGVSRDGLTINYHLRPNVKWTDGQTVT